MCYVRICIADVLLSLICTYSFFIAVIFFRVEPLKLFDPLAKFFFPIFCNFGEIWIQKVIFQQIFHCANRSTSILSFHMLELKMQFLFTWIEWIKFPTLCNPLHRNQEEKKRLNYGVWMRLYNIIQHAVA